MTQRPGRAGWRRGGDPAAESARPGMDAQADPASSTDADQAPASAVGAHAPDHLTPDHPAPDHPAPDRSDAGQPAAGPPDAVTLSTLPWAITEEPDRALPPWFRRAVVLVLALAIGSQVVVWAFGELESFWYTVFFAFFLGLAIEPLVNALAARGIRRGVGTIMVMGGLIAAASVFFAVFGQLLADQLAGLIRSLPDTLAAVLEWANRTLGTSFDVNEILASLGIETKDIAQVAANLGVGLLSVIGTALGWVFQLFTVLLFAFYFAADGPTFRRAIASWLAPHRQRAFLTIWDISTQKAGGYVISRGIMAIISTIFHGFAFYLIDLPYWLPLAMWVGVVSQFIPTIGTYLAGALPIIVALVSGRPGLALAVLIIVTVYQQIENYFVSPRVTRNTLEIHPAVAFGSVMVGSALFGGMGALLAIPVVATVQAVAISYGRRYDLITEFGAAQDATETERLAAAKRGADSRTEPRR